MTDESRALVSRPLADETPAKIADPEATEPLWTSFGDTKLTPETSHALAIVGEYYGLDPALGEICILGGKPYVTARGYQSIAEEHPKYEGLELRVMTPEERKAHMVGPDEHAYVCFIYRKDRRFPIVGYGVAGDRTIQMGPMKPFARDVAQKRAIHRAMKVGFGLRGFRRNVDVIEAAMEVAELPPVETLPEILPADVPPEIGGPDWSTFWAQMRNYDLPDEKVHEILGVASVKEWEGSLGEAIGKIDSYIAARDYTPREDPDQGHTWTRQERIKLYYAEVNRALKNKQPHVKLDSNWSDHEIGERMYALRRENDVYDLQHRLFPEEEPSK